jgi:hypothetical protein
MRRNRRTFGPRYGSWGFTPILAVKPTVGIGCAGMHVVLALLAMEVGAAAFIAAAVLGRKLFREAHASISVPSTEKCSSDHSSLTCGWFKGWIRIWVKKLEARAFDEDARVADPLKIAALEASRAGLAARFLASKSETWSLSHQM